MTTSAKALLLLICTFIFVPIWPVATVLGSQESPKDENDNRPGKAASKPSETDRLKELQEVETEKKKLLDLEYQRKLTRSKLDSGAYVLEAENARLDQKNKILNHLKTIQETRTTIDALKSVDKQKLVDLKEKETLLKGEEDLLKQEQALAKVKREIEFEELGTSPEILGLVSAFLAFGLLLLVLSIIPEKLTDVIKRFSGMTKKDTLVELFGWKSYEELTKVRDTGVLFNSYNVLYEAGQPYKGEDVIAYPSPAKYIDSSTKTVKTDVTAHDLQTALLRLDLRLTNLEKNRVIWLRIWGVVFGVGLCMALQVNAFLQLEPIMPVPLKRYLQTPMGFFPSPGILLTGVGAGMGAPFWQDFLDKLKNARTRIVKKTT